MHRRTSTQDEKHEKLPRKVARQYQRRQYKHAHLAQFPNDCRNSLFVFFKSIFLVCRGL